MAKQTFDSFDDIDGVILQALAENPRIPYSEITDTLSEMGYEMSPEGVRYRVDKIIDLTTVFFLVDPQTVSWEILRVAVSTKDTENSKREAFDFLCEQPFWHVSRGVGTYDLYAVGSLPSLREVDELVTRVREAECISKVEYIVVTGRNQDMTQYLNMDYLPTLEEE
ncbi:Lrp/AsnC family transcriptional regulator [Halalkalicoccus sp. NIPERK01]|uniref:Lrp/AsnC family transcriptional regulator n=1 Tax=Halalkalicoccus sp. NIPERK01 TaxID=3053469 RepID=UPI00256EF982|nr:Lrp/AsnC family transcriptional regulator [Halalkalicoccus sp. NIPERK01]MDL5363401.1 Lrp/AsnC family transcriptional regulator [Halalkalicoccus sp. NIPERK01]